MWKEKSMTKKSKTWKSSSKILKMLIIRECNLRSSRVWLGWSLWMIDTQWPRGTWRALWALWGGTTPSIKARSARTMLSKNKSLSPRNLSVQPFLLTPRGSLRSNLMGSWNWKSWWRSIESTLTLRGRCWNWTFLPTLRSLGSSTQMAISELTLTN